MILNFTDLLTFDLVYEQEPDGAYKTVGADLVSRDLNDVVDTIVDAVAKIYQRISDGVKIDSGKVYWNEFLLTQAIIKYSRDLFGESRLRAKINALRHKLTADEIASLSTFTEYGFKIDSCSPYLHRHIANIFYWFSILKPFFLFPKDNEAAVRLGFLCDFHNEYITYILVMSILKAFDLTLTIHQNTDQFQDFLYDLHFRNVSRSSLEFFLAGYIDHIKK